MDRKPPENPEIQLLIRRSQASRERLTLEAEALRQKLDIPTRIRTSLREHPASWLLGSIGSGLAASFLFRRRPATPKRRAGISGIMIDLILTTARPLAKLWLSGQIKQWAANLYQASGQSRDLTQNPSHAAHVHSPGSGPR